MDQLFASLAGCTVFSQLDLEQAYQQLVVDSVSADLLTVNTHRGLFRVTRLPFGISTAVAIFQRHTEGLLADLTGVHVYLDDIVVGGRNALDHERNLRAVLERIPNDGLRLNKDKCTFGATSIEYLANRIDKDGIHPTEKKVEAIGNAPRPKDKQQLQSFLGLLNFYRRFLRGASHILGPLHRLLGQATRWRWGEEEAAAFSQAKDILVLPCLGTLRREQALGAILRRIILRTGLRAESRGRNGPGSLCGFWIKDNVASRA